MASECCYTITGSHFGWHRADRITQSGNYCDLQVAPPIYIEQGYTDPESPFFLFCTILVRCNQADIAGWGNESPSDMSHKPLGSLETVLNRKDGNLWKRDEIPGSKHFVSILLVPYGSHI